jgi:hypothetical protein
VVEYDKLGDNKLTLEYGAQLNEVAPTPFPPPSPHSVCRVWLSGLAAAAGKTHEGPSRLLRAMALWACLAAWQYWVLVRFGCSLVSLLVGCSSVCNAPSRSVSAVE